MDDQDNVFICLALSNLRLSAQNEAHDYALRAQEARKTGHSMAVAYGALIAAQLLSIASTKEVWGVITGVVVSLVLTYYLISLKRTGYTRSQFWLQARQQVLDRAKANERDIRERTGYTGP